MKSKILNLLGMLVVISMLVANTASAQSTSNLSIKDKLSIEQVFRSVSLKDAIHTSDGRVRVIVQLSDAPVALYQGNVAGLKATNPATLGTTRLDAESADSTAYAAYLQSVQQKFVVSLASMAPGATVNFTYEMAFNGLSLTLDPAKVDAVAEMAGVIKVYPDQIREVQMDASLPLINAPAMWTKLGGKSSAGQGIKVADVDTGLWPSNPMFSGTGFTAPVGYPKGYCATHPADPKFQCNGKVIAARVFADPTLPVATEEYTNPANASPLDIDGHGSHTAGTAAGNEVTVTAGNTVPVDTIISGVAPAAYLLVYHALFEKPDHSGAYGSDGSLIAALNAALSDGADVINNSWGGGAGSDPDANVEKPVIDAITAAGTLVVFSAGNDGPANGTIGCPGCVANALTVAASTTNRIFANQVDITAPGTVPASLTKLAGLQGSGPKLSAEISAPLVFVAANNLGCNAFAADAFKDSVALIQRGTCNFAVKVNNAKAAGALVVIVVNNAGGPPSSMGALEATTIPSLMLEQSVGADVIAWVNSNPTTTTVKLASTVSRMTKDAWQDILAGFSSVGPDGNRNILKPDITAPGVNILSAFSPALSGGTDPVYAFEQGTSMSAPHITGSAALVMQQHPDWSPLQVKTALTSTSVQSMLKPDAKTPADPFNMGAGRVDLARVITAGLTFNQPSFANGACITSCSWTGTLKNVTSTTETWTASVVGLSGLGLTVTPASFALASGYSADFTVTADPTAVSAATWAFGSITWKDTSKTYTDAFLPVAVFAATSTSASVISKTVNKTTANNYDQLTYTITAGNAFTTDAKFFLTDALPNTLAYVDGSATAGMTYDAATRTLKATADIPGLVANLAPTGNPTIYVPHTPDPDNDLILSDLCPSPCDDVAINVTGVDYWYMGVHYTKIGLSSNGLITAGGATSGSNTSAPMILPSTAQPTNVIAPLWGDLVMKGNNPSDKATGIWMVWGDATHTVYEWQDAQSYNNPGDKFTFQVWFGNGTNEITIVYGKLAGSLTVYPYAVGMDNLSGTAGSTYYFADGSGTFIGAKPAIGTDLVVNNLFNTATFTFKANIALKDPLKPFVYNTVDMKNNQNADDPVASARTKINIYNSFIPFSPNK